MNELEKIEQLEKQLKARKREALKKGYEKLGRKFYKKTGAKNITTAENMLDHTPVFEKRETASPTLINISRKSRDFSHGMDRPLLSPFMGLFVCFCIFLVIDIFLDNFFAHIAQCTHIVTRRPKMTAPILATSYFWMIL